MAADPLLLVRTRLLALAAVTALVSTRVYSGILPQTATLPAVSLQLTGSGEPSQLRGSSGILEAMVQVHVVASTRAKAVEIAEAIDGNGAGSALPYFTGLIGSTRVQMILPTVLEREDFRAEELKEYEVMRAYRVVYSR